MEICEHNNVFRSACPECKKADSARSPVERGVVCRFSEMPPRTKFLAGEDSRELWEKADDNWAVRHADGATMPFKGEALFELQGT